jgi:UDP-2,3-diacylglucosamine hydrolase
MAGEKLGLIAGNGSFPLLLLDAARAQGKRVVVAAIKEETSPLIENRGAESVHWLSLGELSKLIETFKREGVSTAVMAGQVKHKQIFSSIRPDWRLAKVLFSLGTRNTDSLIGAVAGVLEEEGIHLISSTSYLEPLLARPGVLTRRAPTDAELKNIEYGRQVGRQLAQYDIGQTVVIAEAACIAVEAMEGTDATILRAGEIMTSAEALHSQPGAAAPSGSARFGAVGTSICPSDANVHSEVTSAFHTEDRGSAPDSARLASALTVVKVAKPKQDMRFDVPVIGVKTIETMQRAGATCLAIDAGKCLFLDGDRVIEAADRAQIAIVAG